MPLTKEQQEKVLKAGRMFIGKTYKQMDCSAFVHNTYVAAGLNYPRVGTEAFGGLAGKYFDKLPANTPLEAGDLVMFPGHVGIWDPQGCQILQNAGTPDKQCHSNHNLLPLLSSRSSHNRGPDFGALNWFTEDLGPVTAIYRWK